MQTQFLDRFAPIIKSLSATELQGSPSLIQKLRIAGDGAIDVCYAPFEYVNPEARVVIVGITPGRTQMLNALKEARRKLDSDADFMTTLIAAKKTGAFSGSMRPNLVALLDHVGVNRWLGISSCNTLFGTAAHLVQTASVLTYPVFANGENYNGTPNMIRHPLLRKQLLSHFGQTVRRLPTALFIPLGDKVAEAMHFVADQGLMNRNHILDGLPHPSGANAERIAYFLGKKKREDLSAKTNAAKLDQAHQELSERIFALA